MPLRHLTLPSEIVVTSISDIKTSTVAETLNQLQPDTHFSVEGINVPSGVGEQPIGQEAIDGALNRLARAIELGNSATRVYVSIENGLFRVPESVHLGDPDLSTTFDPEAEYEDRAVVAVSLRGCSPFVRISPTEDAVRFPRDAIHAAHDAPGGFAAHTAGSVLYESGRVHDKQNPHIDLTEGRLSRQVQMAHVLLDVFTQLSE